MASLLSSASRGSSHGALTSFAGGLLGILWVSLCSAQTLSLAIDDLVIDTAPTFAGGAVGSLDVDLQLANDGIAPAVLTSAQIAVLIRPLADAFGDLDVTAATIPSVFGVPAMTIPGETEGVLTVQVGDFLPATVDSHARGPFTRFNITWSADASGDFELVALDINPLAPLRSSQWLPAGGLGPPFPAPMAFGNTARASGGGILLATISISVPEPTSGVLVCFACCRPAWRRRSPYGISSQT